MKLLLDENLSPSLTLSLVDLFPGSTHVHDCALGSADDAAIWAFAKAKGFTIVSKDSDFHDRSLLYGSPPKLIWLRTGNSTTARLEKLLRDHCAEIREFEASEVETFLALS